jgi:FkbM family methyltransferase
LGAQLAHHVYSFEPNPRLHEWLRANIAENEFRNVTVLDYGLSHQKAVLELQQSDTSLSEATLRSGVTFENTFSISVDRGDEVFSDRPADRPIFIKIDVEGWEHKVLLGLERILSRRDVVVTAEITDNWL